MEGSRFGRDRSRAGRPWGRAGEEKSARRCVCACDFKKGAQKHGRRPARVWAEVPSLAHLAGRARSALTSNNRPAIQRPPEGAPPICVIDGRPAGSSRARRGGAGGKRARQLVKSRARWRRAPNGVRKEESICLYAARDESGPAEITRVDCPAARGPDSLGPKISDGDGR